MREFEVGLGMMMIVTRPCVLSISGIGSCIGLTMRDDETMVSGLAHVVLPTSTNMADAYRTPGKYSDTAVRALIKGLVLVGASTNRITSKIVGGARVLETGGFDGARNIESTREELKRSKVSLVAEEVGQAYGRSMKFDTSTGSIVVRRFEQSPRGPELKDIVTI